MVKSHKKTKVKFKTSFILIYAILIISFFILVEMVLKILNYGLDFSPFIKHKTLERYYATNIYYANKYYSPERTIKEYQAKNLFLRKKAKDTIRGFVVGGSTAEGFPYSSNNSFGKIIEKGLNYSQNKYKFEILNLSFSAMSSYYVNDAMKELKKYDPDFFIIYSGHNEYYGTISATTSKFHIFRKMYIFLRNFKTIQLIQNLLTKKEKSDKNKMLMEEQFAGKKLEKNEKNDEYIAKCFIKNIEDSIELYSKKNIPIFLVEPISNFIDMPPFASKDQDKYSDLIIEYNNAIEKKNINSIVAIENKVDDKLFKYNAHFKYLKAKRENIINNNIDLENYIEAKDFDIIPFRTRSNINNVLKKLFEKNKYKNLYYIKLLDIIKNEYNSNFDNTIFIDHLHFNRRGHKIIAKIITKEIAKYYNIENNDFLNNINNFYSDDELIEKSVNYFSSYGDLSIFMGMHDLFQQTPFKDMKIEYNENPPPLNEITKDRNFFDFLTSNKEKAQEVILAKYRYENNTDKLIDFFVSYQLSNLLDWKAPYNLYKIYESLEEYDKAEYYLLYGYLVSNKNEEMSEAVKEFYEKTGQFEKIKEVKKLKDFPIPWHS